MTNGQPLDSKKKSPISIKHIRETFGIVNGKTGALYPDILRYHLGWDNFCALHCSLHTLEEQGEQYYLHMDSKLKRALAALDMGETVKVVISFQHRTTGRIALARLYK